MIHRTNAGLLLEKLLHGMKHRYSLCWNGEGDGEMYDCGCCMTQFDEKGLSVCVCNCICHERIEIMARHPHISLWLVAMEKFDVWPQDVPPEDEDARKKRLEWLADLGKQSKLADGSAHYHNTNGFFVSYALDTCSVCKSAVNKKAIYNTRTGVLNPPLEPPLKRLNSRHNRY
jgi:hypothetical protein